MYYVSNWRTSRDVVADVSITYVLRDNATQEQKDGGSKQLHEDCLNAHNEYRSRHDGTPSMTWSDQLAQDAQEWANKLAALEILKHSTAKERHGQGENVACCKGKEMTGRGATAMWYSQMEDFDFNSKTFQHKTGHFSQLIWKSSLALGAGIATSRNGWSFCVARYAVAGNVKGTLERWIGNLCAQPQGSDEMDKMREELQKEKEKEHDPTDQSWKDDCLNAHNDYRSKHQATPNLVWSDALASEAQKYANRIACDVIPDHSAACDRPGQGENVAASKGQRLSGRKAVEKWYSEIQDFDFTRKTFKHHTGHFSQLVWRDTREVGAWTVTSKDGWSVCVTRYSPPGNVTATFGENVGDLTK